MHAQSVRVCGAGRSFCIYKTLAGPLYEDETAVDETLKRLGLDYVNLLFIHQPAGNYIAGYRQIEKAYKEGKDRSLGISNMYGEKLEKLLKAADEIAPHVVQLEAHPYCTEKEYMSHLAKYGIKLMGWVSARTWRRRTGI